ncbi:MAG: bifunctional diaminohydroxyphosphoribosylaminopyrimidine deaminase/5-amino-6-(5-phosphoribosylamino)uracil reductase RibD [Nitrospiraceae bacterium]|nr:MAG: bifunctional diaminohydroxyphosphoribosylaminopyrimidine deaminase/5-amino-6-(5-phosphoribosylamino)uracil reductase RibD [Nitrospiraceae bacterium]
MNDKYYMKKALQLAARAKGMTSPNPMVGAVIVKGGKIIASDYHRKAGTPHAEALALKKAGQKAKGATLYINLEPCCHTEKRTPPCTKAIIDSGIKRVVVAMIDPNPKVSGMGLRELRKAGIETHSGVMEENAKRLNEVFIKYITKKQPFVILKAAQSLDGKIATATGESKWITSGKAREYVHRLRNEVDAVLVGAGTVIKDNPSLDCRVKGGRNPYRIIVDSNLRTPLDAKVLSHIDGKTIIATVSPRKITPAYQIKVAHLHNIGVQLLPVKGKNGKVDLESLMKNLGKLQITSIMIEGGSSINASALSAMLVDKIMFFVAPKIIGGVDSIPSIGGCSPSLLKNAYRIKYLRTKMIGEDVLLEGYLKLQGFD